MFNFSWRITEFNLSDAVLNSLYRYALSLVHDQQQAYDLVQNCCEKVLRQKKPAVDLKPYMFKIIRNQFIDQYRRKKLELVADGTLAQQQIIHEQDVVQDLEQLMINRQQVEIMLQDLNYQDRELLYLWAVEGHSIAEIAQRTDRSRNTLLSRLNRLKKRLKQKYGHLNEQVSKDG